MSGSPHGTQGLELLLLYLLDELLPVDELLYLLDDELPYPLDELLPVDELYPLDELPPVDDELPPPHFAAHSSALLYVPTTFCFDVSSFDSATQ